MIAMLPRAATALLTLNLLFVPTTSSVRAQNLDMVTVGTVNAVSDAPLYIADRMGYFRDVGIDVSFANFDSGAGNDPAAWNGET